MARLEIDLPLSLQKKLSELSENEEVAKKAIVAGGEILKEAMKKKIKQEHYLTGNLDRSIKLSKPGITKAGDVIIEVYPSGNDKKRKEVSNFSKIAVIEYGKKGQAPKPFLEKLARDNESKINAAMQSVLDVEVNDD